MQILYTTNRHVYQYPNGFFFWDETDASCCGPFSNFDEANEAQCLYAKTLTAPLEGAEQARAASLICGKRWYHYDKQFDSLVEEN